MAFQGFAREEQFSTNQIKIDINSVIENDLAEASRQSKIMSRNAALQEKWSSMYLNAMIKKHEAEKRNRETNWKSFQENRKAIQKQIEYNNSVKAKDAERSHPYIPDLSAILGPALMKMAVDLGSTAIKKAFKDHNKAKAEAETDERNNVRSAAERYYAESSDDQKKFVAEGGWKDYADANAERQLEIRTYYNSLGQHQVGEISAAYQNKISGMEAVERRGARFSKRNLGIGYTKTLENHVLSINGRNITYADLVANPHNPATVHAFLESAQAEHYETSGLLNEGGPENKNLFISVKKQLEGKIRGLVFNSKVQDASIKNNTSHYHRLESGMEQGGEKGALDMVFNVDNPQSVAAQHGMPRAVEWFKGAIKNGAFTTEQLNKIYDISFGPGIPTINEDIRKNTDRGRQYAALYAAQVTNEQQQHANYQAQQTVARQDYMAMIRQLDPKNPQHVQQARALLGSTNNPSSEITKALLNWKPGEITEFTATLSRVAGVIAPVPVDDIAYDLQSKVLKEGDVSGQVEGTVMDILTETNQPTNTWKEGSVGKAKQAFRNWAAEEIKASKLTNPQDIRNHIYNIVGDDDNPSYKRLKKILAIQTVDPVTKKPIEPTFTYLEKHGVDVGDAPQANGVEEYSNLVTRSDKSGKPLDLREVYRTPEINASMKLLHMKLQNAKDSNFSPQQIQHILSNHGIPFIKERQKRGGLSVGMIVNESLKHGGYDDMDFQPLDDSVFLNGKEMGAIEQMIPRLSQMSLGLQNRLIQQVGSEKPFTPNASTNRIYEINSLAKSKAMGDSSSGPHLDIKKVGGGNFSLKDLDNYIVVHDSEFGDSPLSRLPVTDTYEGHVRRGSHGIDVGIYAGDKISLKNGAKVVSVNPSRHGDVVKIELPNGEQFEWRHGTFSQGQPQQRPITPQQVIPVPSGIGLTPWTPEGNTSAPNPLTETVEWLANFNKGNQ